MGLVIADDGWRIPDEVWAQMEPLLPPRPAHPLGCHNPRVPDREAMNAILLVGLPALPRIGRGRRLPRVLAPRAARLRRAARDRVGVAGTRRRAGQGSAGRREDGTESHRQS